ncbi:MAG: SGNH/GDSL hydrolase family protein [Alphaproteobacteria bacterium]|nr:SGNH/GDSL hydrolase family protein [Alphaproteobacteria bacterium]MCB9796065.1 SGNH/GDSL hydrolase family protein [Alphaproteobacteria bacterium]
MTPRRLLARAALVLGSTVIALLIAEGVVRALGLAPEIGTLEVSTPGGEFVSHPDPVLRYVPRPGAKDINHLGFRDTERDPARTPGVQRVLLLGDSVAYGFCDQRGPLPLDRLLNARLEAELGPDVEVFNLGVSGYDAFQEVRMLELRGLALQPDLVLVAAVANDNGHASMELEALMATEGWAQERALARWSHGRITFGSHLVRMLAARWLTLQPGPGPKRHAKLAYQALAALAREQGFGVRVAMFPDRAERFRDMHHEVMLEAASLAGFPTLDLKDTLLGHEGYYVPCSAMHPNGRGQAKAAEVLAPFVREGLSPTPAPR